MYATLLVLLHNNPDYKIKINVEFSRFVFYSHLGWYFNSICGRKKPPDEQLVFHNINEQSPTAYIIRWEQKYTKTLEYEPILPINNMLIFSN